MDAEALLYAIVVALCFGAHDGVLAGFVAWWLVVEIRSDFDRASDRRALEAAKSAGV